MSPVVGRYAPSPTGDLHFCSLVAAVASYCEARSVGGRWLLRIDDLDTPRVVPGASERIIQTLADFALVPDGPIWFQSARGAAYRDAIETLKQRALAFDCGCTRRQAQAGPIGLEGPIYPGTCRRGLPPGRSPRSVRLCVADHDIVIDDAVQGRVCQNLAHDIGDFVIRRADGITAYQLATVVDDAAQGGTDVVRGADLLSSSPRQCWLGQCLGLPPVRYLHVPIAVDLEGSKLGKSTGALPVANGDRPSALLETLQFLGQPLPRDKTVRRDTASVMAWAVAHWDSRAIPRCREKTWIGSRA